MRRQVVPILHLSMGQVSISVNFEPCVCVGVCDCVCVCVCVCVMREDRVQVCFVQLKGWKTLVHFSASLHEIALCLVKLGNHLLLLG